MVNALPVSELAAHVPVPSSQATAAPLPERAAASDARP
jgi:hypothetical protein